MEQIPQEQLVRAAIFVTAAAYAVWLSIRGRWGGKRWAESQTWVTVVIGVGLVLSWGSLIDPHEYNEKMWARFAVAGLPIVVRSLYIQINEEIEED